MYVMCLSNIYIYKEYSIRISRSWWRSDYNEILFCTSAARSLLLALSLFAIVLNSNPIRHHTQRIPFRVHHTTSHNSSSGPRTTDLLLKCHYTTHKTNNTMCWPCLHNGKPSAWSAHHHFDTHGLGKRNTYTHFQQANQHMHLIPRRIHSIVY